MTGSLATSLLVIVAGVLPALRFYLRGNERIEAWARSEGVTLLHAERRYLRRGPFLFRAVRGHEVFFITALDETGATRHAYVRLGSFWGGIDGGEALVRWVDA